MTIFNVNLNIHYSSPQEVWDKIEKCYAEMPYWKGFVNGCPQWNEWFQLFRDCLTKALGYSIGEPEDGYEFKYWE